MTKPNHTQWHVGMRNGHNANMIYAYDGEDQHRDTGIAMVYGLPSNRHISEIDPEQLDISRLIAASPMLLAELKDARAGMAAILKEYGSKMRKTSVNSIEADIARFDAAIAAATGETK